MGATMMDGRFVLVILGVLILGTLTVGLPLALMLGNGPS
jgi:hypothetical protein